MPGRKGPSTGTMTGSPPLTVDRILATGTESLSDRSSETTFSPRQSGPKAVHQKLVDLLANDPEEKEQVRNTDLN